jgi:hypothetical protein
MQHINRSKNNNHLNISINAEKAFNKIQHHFIIKVLRKLEFLARAIKQEEVIEGIEIGKDTVKIPYLQMI